MAKWFNLRQECPQCNGTGIRASIDNSNACPYCTEGYISCGLSVNLGSLVDKINDIKDKCDAIFEKVNI